MYPSFEEGFGLPALEGLACGAPVVTTSGSALAEVVGTAAVLVPPSDAGGARRRPRTRARRSHGWRPGSAAEGPRHRGRVHVGRVRRPPRGCLPNGPRPRSRRVKALIARRRRLRRHVPRRVPHDRGRRRDRRRPLRRDAPRHHRPRRGRGRRSRGTAPTSSTTSPRCRTSANRSPIRRACCASTWKGPARARRGPRPPECAAIMVIGTAEEYGRVDERDLPLAKTPRCDRRAPTA